MFCVSSIQRLSPPVSKSDQSVSACELNSPSSSLPLHGTPKKNKGRKAVGGVAAAGLDDLGAEARRLLLEDLGGDMDLAEDDAAIAVEGEAISAEGAAALVPGQAVDAVAGEPVLCRICTRPVSAEDTCRQGRGVTGYVVHKFCRNAKSGVMRTATTDEEKKTLEVFAASNPAEFGEHLTKVCGQSGRWGVGNTALAKALIEEISSFTKVSRISDRLLLGERQYIAFFKRWGYADDDAKQAWTDALDNSSVLREIEDGELKLWVKEPTRARGEVGMTKEARVSHKRALDSAEDQEYARRRLANASSVTATVFGATGNILREGASSSGRASSSGGADNVIMDGTQTLDDLFLSSGSSTQPAANPLAGAPAASTGVLPTPRTADQARMLPEASPNKLSLKDLLSQKRAAALRFREVKDALTESVGILKDSIDELGVEHESVKLVNADGIAVSVAAALSAVEEKFTQMQKAVTEVFPEAYAEFTVACDEGAEYVDVAKELIESLVSDVASLKKVEKNKKGAEHYQVTKLVASLTAGSWPSVWAKELAKLERNLEAEEKRDQCFDCVAANEPWDSKSLMVFRPRNMNGVTDETLKKQLMAMKEFPSKIEAELLTKIDGLVKHMASKNSSGNMALASNFTESVSTFCAVDEADMINSPWVMNTKTYAYRVGHPFQPFPCFPQFWMCHRGLLAFWVVPMPVLYELLESMCEKGQPPTNIFPDGLHGKDLAKTLFEAEGVQRVCIKPGEFVFLPAGSLALPLALDGVPSTIALACPCIVEDCFSHVPSKHNALIVASMTTFM